MTFADLNEYELARAVASMRGQTVHEMCAEYAVLIAMARQTLPLGELEVAAVIDEATRHTAAFMHPIIRRPSDTAGSDIAYNAIQNLTMAQSAALWDATLRHRNAGKAGLPLANYTLSDLDQIVDPGPPEAQPYLPDVVEAAIEQFDVAKSDLKTLFKSLGGRWATRADLLEACKRLELERPSVLIESLSPPALACLRAMFSPRPPSAE